MYYADMNISDRLDIAMRRAGYRSQSALARASGVSQPSINRILKKSGVSGPESDTIKKLAQACGVSFQWLLDGADVTTPSNPLLPLIHVTLAELEMLTILRQANPDDQAIVADLFKTISEHQPVEPDPGSLDSN